MAPKAGGLRTLLLPYAAFEGPCEVDFCWEIKQGSFKSILQEADTQFSDSHSGGAEVRGSGRVQPESRLKWSEAPQTLDCQE